MLRIVFRIYLAYLAVVVLLIFPALNFFAPWWIEKTYNRELATEIILFNPFTLSLDVRRAALPERDGTRFVGFSSASVNLSLESLWSQGLVFDAVHLQGLHLEIHRLENGSFNFSSLLATTEESPGTGGDGEGESGVPGITIHDLFLQSKRIQITDESRQPAFSTHYDGLEVAVTDLSTIAVEGKPYTLDVRDEDGGALHWSGEISLPGASSTGLLALSGISLEILGRFIKPWVKIDIQAGKLDLEGRYRLEWNRDLQYHIDDAKLILSDLDIAPQDTKSLPKTRIGLGELRIEGIDIDGVSERVEIDSVAANNLDLAGWSENGRVSIAEMVIPEPKPEANVVPAETESDWSITIGKVAVSDSLMRWRSEYTSPPDLLISPLEVTVEDIKWPPTGDTSVAVNLAINEQAKLNVTAISTMKTGSAEIHYTLSDLPVEWFNPNLPKAFNARIGKGQMNLEGDLELENYSPTTVAMDGDVVDFSMSIQEAENAITAWKTVRWTGLNVDLLQNKVLLEALLLDGYSGRLHIYKDGTINTQRALMAESDQNSTPAGEVQTGKPWSFDVPSVSVIESSLDFMDESLPIPFRAVIGNMNGNIIGISSQPSGKITIDLSGSVDGYAPVKLAGTAQPFAVPAALDLGVTFDGVDLARLTPYSGAYAGYAIDRGLLNLDLNYQLANSRLEGHNQITINQLKLGEKIPSDKAVDVPVKLAIALLTDLNGVIDLAVPVSGDVDDPEFALGDVIFSTLLNIIAKAVTAPFTLLAGLVGSEDDLQSVTFPSGSSEIDETAETKLTDLHGALVQRPGLTLVISGRIHPRADREYLQNKQLRSELIAGGLSESDWDARGQQWTQAISARYELLGINSTEGELPSLPEQVKLVSGSIAIPDKRLEALAEERAVATKRYLVNEAQLPADRAVIEKFDIDDERNLFSGVELDIDG